MLNFFLKQQQIIKGKLQLFIWKVVERCSVCNCRLTWTFSVRNSTKVYQRSAIWVLVWMTSPHHLPWMNNSSYEVQQWFRAKIDYRTRQQPWDPISQRRNMQELSTLQFSGGNTSEKALLTKDREFTSLTHLSFLQKKSWICGSLNDLSVLTGYSLRPWMQRLVKVSDEFRKT